MKTVQLLLLVLASASIIVSSAQQLAPGVGFSSAPELSPGTYSFYLAAGEVHFFKVVLEPGDILVAMVRMASNQDFDLYLLNPMRELVGQSVRAAGLTDAVEYIAAERGPHYIAVAGFGGSTGTYSLTVSVQKPKTVTQTVTATVTQRITETATVLSFVTNTVVSERVATVVESRAVEVERIPWTALGLAVLAGALLYTGYAASDALKNLAKRGQEPSKPEEKPVPQQPQQEQRSV
ncbi:MAG: hypothetical protein QXR26_05730 [Candidatus Caldarchaeum sp.]